MALKHTHVNHYDSEVACHPLNASRAAWRPTLHNHPQAHHNSQCAPADLWCAVKVRAAETDQRQPGAGLQVKTGRYPPDPITDCEVCAWCRPLRGRTIQPLPFFFSRGGSLGAFRAHSTHNVTRRTHGDGDGLLLLFFLLVELDTRDLIRTVGIIDTMIDYDNNDKMDS